MKAEKKEEAEKWVMDVFQGTIDKYGLHKLSESQNSMEYTGTNKNMFMLILSASEYRDYYYFRSMDTAIYLLKALKKSVGDNKESEKIINSSDL